MSDFNYQEYLRNNPLLKEEVKDQLITESQEVEELAVNRMGQEKPNDSSPRSGQYGIGDAVLDLLKKLKKENLSEDKYDDLVAGDKDIPADKKKNAAKALRMLDKGASYEKVKHLLEDEEITKEEVTEETSSKMKVSELKAKIKEDIIALLQEADEEEDVEVEVDDEVEDEIDVDVEEPALDAADSQDGLTADEKEIQDSLKIAYDNAVAMGDQKLADQIGNSITFFTRTHVVER